MVVELVGMVGRGGDVPEESRGGHLRDLPHEHWRVRKRVHIETGDQRRICQNNEYHGITKGAAAVRIYGDSGLHVLRSRGLSPPHRLTPINLYSMLPILVEEEALARPAQPVREGGRP